jgi:branched-subunit amino acid transport protein
MSEMSSNIILVILVTSFATYLSRFLGVVSSEKIDATSKIFRWFNCIAYSILAALIARIVIFPAGVLDEADLWIRLFVLIISIIIFIISKRNLVYPTVTSDIMLAILNNYL